MVKPPPTGRGFFLPSLRRKRQGLPVYTPAAIVAVFTAGKIYPRTSYPFRRSHAAA